MAKKKLSHLTPAGRAKMVDVSGKAVTPFLLSRIAARTEGRALRANIALLKNNARIAGQIACALSNQINQ